MFAVSDSRQSRLHCYQFWNEIARTPCSFIQPCNDMIDVSLRLPGRVLWPSPCSLPRGPAGTLSHRGQVWNPFVFFTKYNLALFIGWEIQYWAKCHIRQCACANLAVWTVQLNNFAHKLAHKSRSWIFLLNLSKPNKNTSLNLHPDIENPLHHTLVCPRTDRVGFYETPMFDRLPSPSRLNDFVCLHSALRFVA